MLHPESKKAMNDRQENVVVVFGAVTLHQDSSEHLSILASA